MGSPLSDANSLAFALIQQPVIAACTVALGLAGILKVANEFMRLRTNLREKPEPRDVQDEARAAGHGLSERVTELNGRVDLVASDHSTLARIVESHERELSTGRQREDACAGKLHKRIDDIAALQHLTSGKVDEGFKHLSASLVEIRSIVLTHGRKT